jgi:hypothetical protein
LTVELCVTARNEQTLTPDGAFDAGWDYPPRMGVFGVLSPRTCPNCTIEKTLWWAITVNHVDPAALTEAQQTTLTRIMGEPATITA